MQEIIIIGGGASGLVAAINIERKGKKVTILEKNSTCGKKILATGNGRCNYFNEDQSINHYRSKNHELIDNVINKSNLDEVLSFFDSIGIVPKIKNGYYYPNSNQAVSIQNALLIEAKNLNIDIKTDTTVFNIKNEKDENQNNIFNVITNQGNFYARKVILATGTKASVKTEENTLGYEFSKKFGHSCIKVLPALVQLRGNEKYFKEWNGIRIDASITLYDNNSNVITKEIGEIQLTDYGVSGICAMNLSGRVSRMVLEGKRPYVSINFLDSLNIEDEIQAKNFIDNRNKNMKNRNIVELLEGIINYKLLNVLLKNLNISNKCAWDEISFDNKKQFILSLINLKINITGTNSFDKSQVCSGGIPLNEIDLNTMESKFIKGLYIIGELLDVDADCGGYNLTWAWTTGIVSSKNI